MDLAHGYEGPPSEFPLPFHIPPGGGEPSVFVGGGLTAVGAACTTGAGVWLSGCVYTCDCVAWTCWAGGGVAIIVVCDATF